MATQEALFDVGDGVTLIEKYCDTCAKKEVPNTFYNLFIEYNDVIIGYT